MKNRHFKILTRLFKVDKYLTGNYTTPALAVVIRNLFPEYRAMPEGEIEEWAARALYSDL